MGKGRREIPPSCRTYGFPIYCAAWAPLAHLSPNPLEEQGGEEEAPEQGEEPGPIAVLGGGGGEGHSGIPNALLLSRFEVQALALSDQPVFRLGTDGAVPYRMAVHPRGDGIICAFPEDCRWFEWNFPGKKVHNLALKSSEKKLTTLEGAGLQLALAFNAEGSTLATGGEDGHLRVFKWPSMEIILDQTDAHTTVKDLDFSSDAKSLVSLGNSGPCRVWDLTSSKVEANLPREDGEIFGFCKFSQNADCTQVLYITAMHGDHGKIITWNTESWKRIGSKRIIRDPISAFNVSTDGKLLAIGTVEGDILVLSSSDMRVQKMIKKAHLGIVTAVVFSQDSRFLISASFDSTARVTTLEGKKKNGLSVWLIIFVILLAIMAYYININEVMKGWGFYHAKK
ncbi:hypothetical protein J5N97_019417 [Dioscorea zingiberensis]|uniref:SEC12-like protein 2 n=1 Tax=Dioscorea zingiberensis TaxID=325984 RepID=A0A9D5CE32_9LILI|nr:hypothetical protein J5N97_019417 [Dioscorea zingiberensis]